MVVDECRDRYAGTASATLTIEGSLASYCAGVAGGDGILSYQGQQHSFTPFRLEHPMPVNYKGLQLDCGYRIDILVDSRLILELKAVEEVKGIHKAQLLTYMKLAGINTGLLINFHVRRLVDGIQRFKL